MIHSDTFSTVGNRNEYSIKRVQIVSLQPNYVSTLPGITKNHTTIKMAEMVKIADVLGMGMGLTKTHSTKGFFITFSNWPYYPYMNVNQP